jgi:hypothetical protein
MNSMVRITNNCMTIRWLSIHITMSARWNIRTRYFSKTPRCAKELSTPREYLVELRDQQDEVSLRSRNWIRMTTRTR